MEGKDDEGTPKGRFGISTMVGSGDVPKDAGRRVEVFASVLVHDDMFVALRRGDVMRSVCVYRVQGESEQCFWISGYQSGNLLHRLVIPLQQDYARLALGASRRGRFMLEFHVRDKPGRLLEQFEISDVAAGLLNASLTQSEDTTANAQATVTVMNEMLRADALKSIEAECGCRRVFVTLVAPSHVRTEFEQLRIMRVLRMYVGGRKQFPESHACSTCLGPSLRIP